MRFAIVGNGKMAIDVLGVVDATPGAKVVLCLGDPAKEAAQSGVARACAKLGVPYTIAHSLGDATALPVLAELAPDYIISANNFLTFDEHSLALARYGVVNFHNSLLPRHAGLNACSWAILTGDADHGVTWHIADKGIDTGNILSQKRFAVAADETAISLIARCITAGVEIFRPLMLRLMAGRVEGRPQPSKGRVYHGRGDLPWNGELPWREPVTMLGRLARALDFHPAENLFYRPRVMVKPDCPIWIKGFSVDTTLPHGLDEPSGTIVAVRDNEIRISVTGGTITLFEPCDADGLAYGVASLFERCGFAPGCMLADPEVSYHGE